MGLFFTSCKKDYNCTCKYGSVTYDGELYKGVSKSDTESRCSHYEQEVREAFDNNEINCTVNEAD